MVACTLHVRSTWYIFLCARPIAQKGYSTMTIRDYFTTQQKKNIDTQVFTEGKLFVNGRLARYITFVGADRYLVTTWSGYDFEVPGYTLVS